MTANPGEIPQSSPIPFNERIPQFRLTVETLTTDLSKAITAGLQNNIHSHYKDLVSMFSSRVIRSAQNDMNFVEFDAKNYKVAQSIMTQTTDDAKVGWKLTPGSNSEHERNMSGETAYKRFHMILMAIRKDLRKYSKGGTQFRDNYESQHTLEKFLIPLDGGLDLHISVESIEGALKHWQQGNDAFLEMKVTIRNKKDASAGMKSEVMDVLTDSTVKKQ